MQVPRLYRYFAGFATGAPSGPAAFSMSMEWLGQIFTHRMQAVHRLVPFSWSMGITSLPR